MKDGAKYNIRYTREALGHLRGMERKDRRLIAEVIHEQLSHEPFIATRNRKPLQASELFGPETWELRFGPQNRFRAFYEKDESESIIYVLAVGLKDRARLLIDGKEVSL